jgi:hypothetical protein
VTKLPTGPLRVYCHAMGIIPVVDEVQAAVSANPNNGLNPRALAALPRPALAISWQRADGSSVDFINVHLKSTVRRGGSGDWLEEAHDAPGLAPHLPGHLPSSSRGRSRHALDQRTRDGVDAAPLKHRRARRAAPRTLERAPADPSPAVHAKWGGPWFEGGGRCRPLLH